MTEIMMEGPQRQMMPAEVAREVSKKKVSKLFNAAIHYGIIFPGFTSTDYLRYAIENYGWESTPITGIKASAKSNLMLQRGFAIYRNWDTVMKYVVTEKEQLLDLLSTTDRIPWMGIDDIAAYFPRSLYFTDRNLYAQLSSSWETLRTKISCLDFTATRKNKVASFILEDITGDIVCYDRHGEVKSHYDYQRWMWIRDLNEPTEMKARIIRVEDIPFPLLPESFGLDVELREGEFVSSGQVHRGEEFFKKHACLEGVPRNVFLKYWDRRLELSNRSYTIFKDNLVRAKVMRQKKLEEPKPALPMSEVRQAASSLGKRSHIHDSHP